ncbi:hypothetical protein [Aegicerativicinus sediminis]|uniref:hypothetical protein n=1 Tax=Aegicerativicinus sediminis TaxID=2893202 RepID=UPI001E4DB2B4|nr:hypothetical protein [Aegicerativicinus sediminis]
MKHLIATLIFTGILISCNSSEKKEVQTEEPTATETSQETPAEATINLTPINTDEALLATALMAAPEESRDGCKVIGFNMAGEFVTMREGNNEFIVLADDPKKVGFSAACYHESLEPFMARGRELKAEGKTPQEIFEIRENEIKAGNLKMGDPGSTLHIYFGAGEQYDPETSKVDGAHYRYVVYLPFATSESTGLPESPVSPNHPWIMDPGTHRAHIMISPKREE